MQKYTPFRHKHSGETIVHKHGGKASLLSLLLPLYGVGVVIGIAPATPLLWAVVLGVVVVGLSVDVYARRLTHDSWKPHKLFWPTMIATIPLSLGVTSVIVVPGYWFELLLATR